MKTKYIATLLSVLLFASVFTLSFTINKASAQGTTTLTVGSAPETPSDTSFTVPVQITNVEDFFGFDINITWNNTLINFASLDNTTLGGSTGIWPQGFFEPLAFESPYTTVQSGAGYVRYSAVAEGGSGYTNTGTATIFTLTFNIVKTGNFPYATTLHIDTTSLKLSDHNGDPITAATTDGTYTMSAQSPEIDFTMVNPHAKPWEYGKYFQVQVSATHLISTLTGYDFKLDYTAELLTFDKEWITWGTAVTGTVNNSTTGVVEVSISGLSITGDNILLFTLTFQVAFDDSYNHIWRMNNTGPLTGESVYLDATYGNLVFTEGPLNVDGSGPTVITLPSSVNPPPINLIQGDVDCNGHVDVFDLRTIAYYYGQNTTAWIPPGTAPAKYDLKTDGAIDLYDLVKVAANFGYNNPDSFP